MTDRRRSDEYKQVSGYVPQELARAFKTICASEGMSQSDALEEMLYEWVAKKTGSTSLVCEPDTPRTFADIVRVNMSKLKRCGVRNLQALAKGEVLPTPGDFAIVISNLGISESEQKTIWEETFKISVEKEFSSVKVYKDSGGFTKGECEYS